MITIKLTVREGVRTHTRAQLQQHTQMQIRERNNKEIE
jgi:hypothetical protein